MYGENTLSRLITISAKKSRRLSVIGWRLLTIDENTSYSLKGFIKIKIGVSLLHAANLSLKLSNAGLKAHALLLERSIRSLKR